MKKFDNISAIYHLLEDHEANQSSSSPQQRPPARSFSGSVGGGGVVSPHSFPSSRRRSAAMPASVPASVIDAVKRSGVSGVHPGPAPPLLLPQFIPETEIRPPSPLFPRNPSPVDISIETLPQGTGQTPWPRVAPLPAEEEAAQTMDPNLARYLSMRRHTVVAGMPGQPTIADLRARFGASPKLPSDDSDKRFAAAVTEEATEQPAPLGRKSPGNTRMKRINK